MNEYVCCDIPCHDKDGNYVAWWNPANVPLVIKILENENPSYKFHQFVTSPGNGGYSEFAIMKIKS